MTRYITLNGKTRSLEEWSKHTGLGKVTITSRLKAGWPIADALTKTAAPPVFTLNGRTLTLTEWAKRAGMARVTLAARLRLGWSFEQAINAPVAPYRHRGLVADFSDLSGTGGGPVAQESTELEFSK
jgi:lambda repressor-like predicted transcriptional regulator